MMMMKMKKKKKKKKKKKNELPGEKKSGAKVTFRLISQNKSYNKNMI